MASQKNGKSSKQSAKKRKKVDSSKGICFTIMPFGGWFDDYYAVVYRPAIESTGLVPRRADDLYRPSTIVNDIWAYTQEARLILADLTGKNPNVFYELGLAHGLAKPAILVTETITDVPFDLRALRVIEYDKNAPDWGVTLRQKITASINEVLEAPLQAVLPTFLESKALTANTKISEQDKEVLNLRQEMDLLRAELRSRPREETLLSSSSPISGPGEARQAIRAYKALGLPKQVILDRLIERGVPSSWAEDELNIGSRRLLQPSLLEDADNLMVHEKEATNKKTSKKESPISRKKSKKTKAAKKKRK